MQLHEVQFGGGRPIDGYGPGFFRVAGEVIRGPIFVMPSAALAWGGYEDLASVRAHAGEVDILFLGTGAEIAHAPAGFRAAVEAMGPGLEAMATPAACRTYNVLLSEGRRVGALLLPVA